MNEQSSAAIAAQQVQAIVAAAEESARQIRQQAEADAAAYVAGAKASVEGLVEQAATLRVRMEELEGSVLELKATVDALAESAPAASAVPAADPEPVAPAAEPAADAQPAMAAAAVPEAAAEADPEPEADLEPETAAEPESASEPAAAGTTAPEGVRLIALNMALSGKPREETAQYLRENFQFEESDSLLDEVYAKAGS